MPKFCASQVLLTKMNCGKLVKVGARHAFSSRHRRPLLVKASDLFVKCLENEGITHIFGIPGEENADLMMSLHKSSAIKFILTRHEQGAAFMAEVFGRLSGRPACCLATLGPGATNLITGVANSNMDRAPMLVVTGQGATTRQHKESHQIIDVVSMYRPVTKWATSILHPSSIPEILRKAVRVARTEKPGAVLIELAEDVAKANVPDELAKNLQVNTVRRPAPDSLALEEAWKHITSCKKPIIIAGNGTVRTRASALLRKFCEATGIGVISTFMGKGSVDMDAPYCVYTIGLQAKDYTAMLVEQSDLVITVGYDVVEYPPRLWNATGSKRIICIDFEPAVIDHNYNPVVEVVADIGLTLQSLTEMAVQEKHSSLREIDFETPRKIRKILQADFAIHKDDDTEGSIRPQKVLWDVRQFLDKVNRHAVLLSGVGAHKMWIGRYFHAHYPNTVLIPNGFCSMGLALPGAIAADMAFQGKVPVVAICGDGDFLMNVQEMETARRMNSRIIVMVWVDGGYGLISWKQDNEYGTHTNLSFGNPNWLELAKAFGWHGEYVSRSRDLDGSLRRCLEFDGPSLIAIPIDYRENALLTQRLGRIVSTL